MSIRLGLEPLESRTLPAVSALLTAGTLSLVGRQGQTHDVLVRPGQDNTVEVLADGVLTSFAGVTRVDYQGSNRADSFVNRTLLPGTIDVSGGDNRVVIAAQNSTVTASNGDNFIQALAGGNTITVGDGSNNVYGGVGDVIVAGRGANIIYDILPGNQTVTIGAGNAASFLFVGPNTVLTGAGPQDKVARFFVPGRTIGSGTLVLDQGTLYFTASNAGDTYVANEFG